jgi:hypothetical protein
LIFAAIALAFGIAYVALGSHMGNGSFGAVFLFGALSMLQAIAAAARGEGIFSSAFPLFALDLIIFFLALQGVTELRTAEESKPPLTERNAKPRELAEPALDVLIPDTATQEVNDAEWDRMAQQVHAGPESLAPMPARDWDGFARLDAGIAILLVLNHLYACVAFMPSGGEGFAGVGVIILWPVTLVLALLGILLYIATRKDLAGKRWAPGVRLLARVSIIGLGLLTWQFATLPIQHLLGRS